MGAFLCNQRYTMFASLQRNLYSKNEEMIFTFAKINVGSI
ncbi:MAG: hypothetical protein RLZZ65_961 [Bacteroidota bacterium]|jgi:hypothetical protein